MKRIFSFFRSFHFIFLLAVILLAVVIYFYSPHIPFLGDYRYESFWALAVIYITYYVFAFIAWTIKKWRIRQARLAGEPEEAEVLLYIDQVEKFIRRASSELGVKRSIKNLPLHWVSGARSAGKTSFIKGGSKDPEKVRTLELALGKNSTSWHLSDKGIFFEWPMDAASGASQKLLVRLFRWTVRKSSRLGQLSDVVFLLSVDDLTLLSAEELKMRSKEFAELMQACATGTGRIYPAYLVLSHLDHLHGCQSYFDRLDKQSRLDFLGAVSSGQQWCKATPETLMHRIGQQIEAMYDYVMHQPVPANLSSTEKLAWSSFPFQARQLTARLGDFMETATGETAFLSHPGFSGAFLSAAHKDNYESIFHATNQSGFFKRETAVQWRKEGGPALLLEGVHQLLSSGVRSAPVASRQTSLRNFRKSMLAGLALLSVTVTSLGTVYSDWREHEELINGFRESVARLATQYNEVDTHPMASIALYGDAIGQFEAMQEQKSYLAAVGIDLPLMTAGTESRLGSFLTGTLKDEFDSVLAQSLASSLQRQSRQWNGLSDQQKSLQRDAYYAQLEAYLMMTRFPDRMQPDMAATTTASVWYEDRMQSTPTHMDSLALEAIQSTLTYFYTHAFDNRQAERWTANNYNSSLVAQARSNLAVEATAEAIYQLLISKNRQRFETMKLSDVIPSGYPYILRNDYQFSSMYSRDIWEHYIADEIRTTVQRISVDDWVLDAQQGSRSDSPAAGPLETRVRELYFEDYRKHWEAYVQAFYMPEYRTLDEVHHNLRLLGGERSPLRPLSQHVQYQIGAYQLFERQTQPVSALLARSQSRFSALQSFVEFYQASNAAEFDQYLNDIGLLAAEIESMLASARVSNEALKYAAAMLSDQGGGQQLHALNLSINRIKLGHEPRAGDLLQHVLLLPVKTTWQTILTTSRDAMQAEWERNVYEQYMAHLNGRFPFELSNEDAPLSVFYQFFGVDQGTLWRFHHEMTSPFVTLHTSSIQHHTWLGMGLAFSNAYLDALKNGGQIARALLGQSGEEVGFRYALLPEPVPGITESRFLLDEFLLTYRNEPQQWSDHAWSAGRQNSVARIQLRPIGQPLAISHQSEGGWSLLRLLYEARASRISSTEYELVWMLNSGNGQQMNARYRFRSDQAALFLNKQLFTNYRLPRHIF
ncbi:MAG: hypothetical protein JXQ97_15835 [Natronospirillum sp.]